MSFESVEIVTNEGPDDIELVIEPWATTYSLPAGAKYYVSGKSEIQGAFELQHETGRVTCWAWPGATLEVWDGERRVQSFDQPVPTVPDGMTLRQFFGLLGMSLRD